MKGNKKFKISGKKRTPAGSRGALFPTYLN